MSYVGKQLRIVFIFIAVIIVLAWLVFDRLFDVIKGLF